MIEFLMFISRSLALRKTVPEVEIVDFFEVIEEFWVDVDPLVVAVVSVKLMDNLYSF
jgi:hypothetical protein